MQLTESITLIQIRLVRSAPSEDSVSPVGLFFQRDIPLQVSVSTRSTGLPSLSFSTRLTSVALLAVLGLAGRRVLV